MRPLRPLGVKFVPLVIFIVATTSIALIARQTIQLTTTPPSPSTLLGQSLVALVGNTRVSDVTLSGTARRVAGSDDESGTVTLKALSSGATRLDFNFPSGPRSEFKSFASGVPVGSWTGPDSVSHPIAQHNLLHDWGWFPLFAVASSTNAQSSAISSVGSETRNGQSVVHIVVSQQFASLSEADSALMRRLSQIDIFLDAASLLPYSISYNIHPDNNDLLDIPVELQFSDYRALNGAQIPFHIQKFINNTLALDLQFQSAAVNTGLTAAQVGVQ